MDCTLVIAHAFEWIQNNLKEFDPFKEDRPFEILHGQRVAELATMLYCYVELTGDDSSDGIHRIITLLREVQGKHEFSDRLLRSPEEFALVGNLYGVLRLLGHDNLQQRGLIERALESGFLAHSERQPHRMMEVRMCLDWGGFNHPWPSWETLWESSLLSQIPNALYLDEMPTYALTHVILFYYGFGTRHAGSAPPASVQGLRDVLTLLLVCACQDGHWDLLGELLLCWNCIGLEQGAIYQQAWETFLGKQQEDGAFPGPERALAVIMAKDEQRNDKEKYKAYISHHYHTTLVGIIAAALHSSRSKHARPYTHPGGEASQEYTEAAVRCDAADSDCSAVVRQSRNWLEGLLDAAQQRASAPPAALCNILIGYWISESVSGSEDSAYPHRAQQVWNELIAREQGADGDPAKAPPALRLIATALLASQGHVVPSLHAFLATAAQVLNDTPATDALTDLSLAEKRVLLYHLGLHPLPSMLGYSDVIDFARALPLSASGDAIEELLLRIYSYTAYGTRRVTLDPGDAWLQELLAGLATNFFRQYDFILGCKLLRAMCYLGATDNRYAHALIGFIQLHQRPQGAFGFFGIEEPTLRKTMLPTFSLDLDLQLPVTVGCLWALAEASNRNWRLYRELPRLAQDRF